MEINKSPIENIAQGIVEKYRQILKDDNINASYNLSDKASIRVDVNGNTLMIYIRLLKDYWKVVETGRRPGYYVPIKPIKEWIEIKPVIPESRNGFLPTKEQLPYMIANKIRKKGIPGKKVLERTLESPEFDDVVKQIELELIRQLKQYLIDL